MKLMTKEIRKTLPPIGSGENTNYGAGIAYVKFFDPVDSWTWYAMEFDGEDIFYGLVDGFEKEFGYFSLSELQNVKLRFGLGIERDIYFSPTPVSELL